MNSLSWLLYAAEVAETLKTGGGLLGTFALAGAVVAYPASLMFGDTYSWDSAEEKATIKARPAAIRKAAKAIAIASLPILLVSAVLPSKSTIMMIAASEVGGTILSSEKAQEIGGEAGALATDSLKVLRKFINDQLDEAAE